MGIKIKIFREADRVLDLVRELREQGLVQGRDFAFWYHPTEYDPDGWSVLVGRHAELEFLKGSEPWATWLLLRCPDLATAPAYDH